MCRYNVIVCHLYVAVSFAAFLFYFSACLAGRSCRSIRSEFIYQTIKRNEHYLKKIRLTFADYKAVTTIEASEAIASLKYPSILFLIPSIFDSTIYESSNSFPILSVLVFLFFFNKYCVHVFVLLFIYAYSHVGFKSSSELVL